MFPAEDVALVRPYYAAHERSAARHAAPAAEEHELARIQDQALARLRGWTTPNTSYPQMPTAPPARALIPAIPRPRSAPLGDILAAPLEPLARPAVRHRHTTGPATPTGHAKPLIGEGYEELAAVTRQWLAQQGRREVRV